MRSSLQRAMTPAFVPFLPRPLLFPTSPTPISRPFHRSQSQACARPPTHASPGTLYLVSTPIGHPHDITRRACDILSTVDAIAAEDTRVTSALLSTLSLRRSHQPLLSCHAHNIQARLPDLLQRLSTGQSIALVCDAGTPGVSDPGADIVTAAVEAGTSVVPIPGPSAVLAALAASGLRAPSFAFHGFLPRSGGARNRGLQRVAKDEHHAVVLYEAPHRLRDTLRDLSEMATVASRKIVIGRELTKKFEEMLRFNKVDEAVKHFQEVDPRGEFTLVLDVSDETKIRKKETLDDFGEVNVDVRTLVDQLVREGVAVSAVARCVAGASDVPKKVVYGYAGELKRRMEEEEKHRVSG